MIKRQILIIDDDLTLCRSIQNRMRSSGVAVTYADSPSKSFKNFMEHKYSLVIMDIQLAEINGMEVLRTIRSTKFTPILVLARNLDSQKKIALLKAGADVCLEKPVEVDVCIAQAQVLLQRYKGGVGMSGLLTYGTELIINLSHREVLVDGQPLNLTRKEFDLFFCLANSPGQVFTFEQLYEHIWKEEAVIGGRDTVKAHIKTLRKKLAVTGKKYIQNIWGIGYKFVVDGTNDGV